MKDISEPDVRKDIIVCPPRKSSILKAQKRLKGRAFKWVYLGEDVARLIFIERQIGNAGKRIEIGERLQETASSLRQAYIDYIGQLSITHDSLLWWLGSLSEKNPWVSKAFLYACYMRLCQTIIRTEGKENLVFIGENKAIRTGIRENLVNYEIQHIGAPFQDFFAALKNAAKLAALKVYFLVQNISHIWLARRYRIRAETQDKEGLVLLHNWVDPRSFNAAGEYRDNYLGGLAHHLKSKGKNIVVVPHILPTVPYRQTLKKLARNLNSLLLAESYLTVADVFGTLLKTLGKAPRKKAFPKFEGIEVSNIIRNDLYKDRAGIFFPSTLLLYEAVKRWKKAGIPIQAFIYAYENQVWEKAYCAALKKYYPQTKITGYQHATVPKMLLNHFFSVAERPMLPFPDRVITAGKYTERLFKESGYDPAKVICGGAIRYANLPKKNSAPRKRDTGNPVILVTPSIDKNETMELVWKVTKAFEKEKGYSIVFKFHPDCPFRVIAGDIGALPEHFIVADKPMSELLPETSVLLYSSSATSIEAIALGVPIIHVKSDFTIDRDNLVDFPGVSESVCAPADIIKATESLLKMDEKDLSQKSQLWSEVVAEMFGPADTGTYDLFL